MGPRLGSALLLWVFCSSQSPQLPGRQPARIITGTSGARMPGCRYCKRVRGQQCHSRWAHNAVDNHPERARLGQEVDVRRTENGLSCLTPCLTVSGQSTMHHWTKPGDRTTRAGIVGGAGLTTRHRFCWEIRLSLSLDRHFGRKTPGNPATPGSESVRYSRSLDGRAARLRA
jgi:hypothetical protein